MGDICPVRRARGLAVWAKVSARQAELDKLSTLLKMFDVDGRCYYVSPRQYSPWTKPNLPFRLHIRFRNSNTGRMEMIQYPSLEMLAEHVQTAIRNRW